MPAIISAGWLPPGMHNLVIAQTNFPSLSSREYLSGSNTRSGW